MTKRAPALALFCLLSMPFLSSYTWADDTEYDGYWYLSAGAGRSLYWMDKDNYVNPGPNWPDDHYYKNDIHDGNFVNVGGGYALTRYHDWFPAFFFGLSYDYAFSGKVSGHINQYNLNQFQNYTYSYDFSRQTLLGVVKADIVRWNCLMPYLTAGTGVSFNKASGYKEQPLANVTPRISPGYASNTNAYWSYMLGIGVDYAMREDIWMSLEYNYADFGLVQTGRGAGTQTVTGVNYSDQHLQNKLKANTFLLSFTYLIDYV
ncbi:MAG: outer membrane beta-barrel protein [Gammaproteobacteria bacterium]|nr:outer membrane beta-barrel protein [Gammaproteobacteria bacterium]MCW5583022.1 outer membrane beta-barrel protein [Gammaproteobacteria bacterium]